VGVGGVQVHYCAHKSVKRCGGIRVRLSGPPRGVGVSAPREAGYQGPQCLMVLVAQPSLKKVARSLARRSTTMLRATTAARKLLLLLLLLLLPQHPSTTATTCGGRRVLDGA
jgi:hypothetical protein